MTSTIPVQCSTNWALKPHIGSEINIYWVHISHEEWNDIFRLLLSNCLHSIFYCNDHSSLSPTTTVQMNYFIYFTSFHPSLEIWTQKIDLTPNVWLPSSAGRASQQYCGGHRLKSRWSSAGIFRLLLSNCSNWKIACHDHSSVSMLIIKITISLLVIGLKQSYFLLIRLPRCYWTVSYWIVCYWTVCYWTVW